MNRSVRINSILFENANEMEDLRSKIHRVDELLTIYLRRVSRSLALNQGIGTSQRKQIVLCANAEENQQGSFYYSQPSDTIPVEIL
jgi:hypothetical protein